MAAKSAPWTNRLLNVGLVLGVVALVVLAYNLATETFGRPEVAVGLEAAEGVGIVQVEVLNGCGEEGLAADLRGRLRADGFDVVAVGDFGRFDVAETHVIDRTGNAAGARAVAEALGLPPERVRTDVDPHRYLDASVVIGHDYRELPPFQETGGE